MLFFQIINNLKNKKKRHLELQISAHRLIKVKKYNVLLLKTMILILINLKIYLYKLADVINDVYLIPQISFVF